MKYLKPFKLFESLHNHTSLDRNIVMIFNDILQEASDEGYLINLDEILYEISSPLNNLHVKMLDGKTVNNMGMTTDWIKRLADFRRGLKLSIGSPNTNQIMSKLLDQNWNVYIDNKLLFDKIANKLKADGFDYEFQYSKGEAFFIITNTPFELPDKDLSKLRNDLSKVN